MPPKKGTRLRDKIKNVHLTIKGHSFLNPFPIEEIDLYFECRERGDSNSTPHIHVGY